MTRTVTPQLAPSRGEGMWRRLRWALRGPTQRHADAELRVALDRQGAEMELRAALSTIPEPVGNGMWTAYPCPHCDGDPVGGWKWWTEPGTWQERLHLSLRCQRRHTWSVSTDMG